MPANSYISLKLLEEMLLNEVDRMIAKSDNQSEKVIFELFKSSILKKYQDSYDVEVLHGGVKDETLDGCIKLAFSKACFIYRQMKDIDDSTKEVEITRTKQQLPMYKATIAKFLQDKGIKII